MTLSGKTQVYGVVGYPVKHSLSPVFQNRAFGYFSIDAVYVPFEVKPEDFETAFLGFKVIGVKGLNITLPHKEKALKLSDFADEHAQSIGAVNTLKFEEGRVYAYNTDWIGFLKSVGELLPDLKDKKVLVLGAGGSSRAVLYALRKEGSKVFLWNRTKEKALSLCKEFDCSFVEKPEEVLREVELVVNTTSVGLRDEDPPLFDYSKLEPHHRLMDIIYRETPLLKAGKEKGCLVKDGLDMLLYQGIESFRIWTSLEVPYHVVKGAVVEYLHGYLRA